MNKKFNSKVIIYILNHNYGKYIKKSINSALNQNYNDFKILIVDDGSTDNSKNILKKYENNEKIKIIYQKKKIGMIKCILKSIHSTDSEYFVRLDADDWLHKDFLKETMRSIESNKKIGLVFPDYFEVDSHGKVINRIKRNKFNQKNNLLDFPAHGACTLFKRKIYNKTEGYNSKIKAQDGYDIWLKIIKKFDVRSVNKPLFFYRQHQNNLTKNIKNILDNRYKILENQSEIINNSKTLAFIPILENEEKKLFCLNKFQGKKLIDITLDKVLKSKKINQICVSTNSLNLIKYLSSKKKLKNKITIHIRNKKKLYNLTNALYDFLKKNNNKIFKNIAILTTEYPLTTKYELDAAINSLNIFNATAVESVVNLNNIFYYNSKNGMKIWGNKILKKERDNIYIRKGGITILEKKEFLKSKKIIKKKKLAHLLIHPVASLNYQEIIEYNKILNK